MAELFVFGDECGQEGDEYCVVAGYIGSLSQWTSFNAAWKAVVDGAEDFEFHSKLFFDRKVDPNRYSGWPEQKATAYLRDLVKVISDHRRLTGIGVGLDVGEWNDLTWGERNLITGARWHNQRKKFVAGGAPSRAYHLPFNSMIGEGLDLAKPPDSVVHFKMDENPQLQPNIDMLFEWTKGPECALRDDLKRKMGELTWGKSHEHPGIQAADLLADVWHAWLHKGTGLTGERLTALYELIRNHRRDMGVIRQRGLKHIVDNSLTLDDLDLVRAAKSPKDMNPPKVKRPWPKPPGLRRHPRTKGRPGQSRGDPGYVHL